MARLTIEDCIDKIENRFELIVLTSHRARKLAQGAPLTVDRDRDKNTVVALREIAEGTIVPEDLKEELTHFLQKNVEYDDDVAETEAVPLLGSTAAARDDDISPEFDKPMNEEDLIQGLEELVPPAQTEEDE